VNKSKRMAQLKHRRKRKKLEAAKKEQKTAHKAG
jgi:hypothetical protein